MYTEEKRSVIIDILMFVAIPFYLTGVIIKELFLLAYDMIRGRV